MRHVNVTNGSHRERRGYPHRRFGQIEKLAAASFSSLTRVIAYHAAVARSSVLLLAHGASGNAESMRPWATALAPLGIDVVLVSLPKGSAERAVPKYAAALDAHPGAAIGGHSFGGRVASMLAASRDDVSALVLLSYPLHRPGHADERRTEHWADVKCPVLLLSGERDAFARIDFLRSEVAHWSNADLLTYPGLGHGLLSIATDVAPAIATFLKRKRP